MSNNGIVFIDCISFHVCNYYQIPIQSKRIPACNGEEEEEEEEEEEVVVDRKTTHTYILTFVDP